MPAGRATGGREPGAVFDALGDPTRRTVLEAVAALGPVTATELAGRFPVSRQALVKHLNALAAVGLVAAERSGRAVRFRFVRAPLDDATTWMAEVGQAWDDRLARLRTQLEG